MTKELGASNRGQMRVSMLILAGIWLLLAIPITVFAFLPFEQLSQVALRATAAAVGITLLGAIGNLLSLPVFAQAVLLGAKLDAWGKSLRFAAAAAGFWAALLVLVVGSIPVLFGGGSFGGEGGSGSW